jgi:hypothetical protein
MILEKVKQLHVSALRPSSGWILGLNKLFTMMGVGGGTRSRFTVVFGGVSAGWVWHVLVAIARSERGDTWMRRKA